MEPIVSPQPGNATGPPLRPSRKHHIILVVLAILAGILYLAGNVWLFFRMREKQQTTVPQAIQRFVEQGAQSTPSLTPSPTPRNVLQTLFGKTAPLAPSQIITATPTPIPTPTPTPRSTGPGPFACAPDGTCNRYGENARKQYCNVTYADSQCLDSCGDPAKRCTK